MHDFLPVYHTKLGRWWNFFRRCQFFIHCRNYSTAVCKIVDVFDKTLVRLCSYKYPYLGGINVKVVESVEKAEWSSMVPFTASRQCTQSTANNNGYIPSLAMHLRGRRSKLLTSRGGIRTIQRVKLYRRGAPGRQQGCNCVDIVDCIEEEARCGGRWSGWSQDGTLAVTLHHGFFGLYTTFAFILALVKIFGQTKMRNTTFRVMLDGGS